MGKIKKILENELIGGNKEQEVYPVTSTKAVYDANNESLDNILIKSNNNTGVSEYPLFSTKEHYNAGDVVTYIDGLLYEFKVNHSIGEWNPDEVNPTSINNRVTKLNKDFIKELLNLGLTSENIESYISDNILPVEGWEQGYIDTNSGVPTGDSGYITSPFINISAGTYVLCSYNINTIAKRSIVDFATYGYDKKLNLVGFQTNPFTIDKDTLIRLSISGDVGNSMLVKESLYNELVNSPRLIEYVQKYLIKNKLKVSIDSIDGDPSDLCTKINNKLSSTVVLTENMKQYVSENILPSDGWEDGFISGNGDTNGDPTYHTSTFVKVEKGKQYVTCYYLKATNQVQSSSIINFATYKPDKTLIKVYNPGAITNPFTIDHEGFIRYSVSNPVNETNKGNFMVVTKELYDNLLKNPRLIEYFNYYVLENIKIPHESIQGDPSDLCTKINENLDFINKNIVPEVEEKQHNIYAYSTTEEAKKYGVVENGSTIFVGDSNNINAIQRAINSIPNDTPILWTIYAVGEFICNSYEKMSTKDTVTENNYRCYISVANKQNIILSGVGSKETLISVSLPEKAGDVTTSDYHPLLIKKVKNCAFRNFKIYGHNIRYTIHINGLGQEYQTLKFENVDTTFKKNTGDHASWSGANIGCDIASGLRLIFQYCNGAQLIGHYTSNGNGTTKISFIGCKDPTMNFLPIESGKTPRLDSVAVVEFINNDMRGYSPIILSPNQNALKTLYTGYGNMSPYIPPIKLAPYCNIYDIFEIYSKACTKGSLVDSKGNLSNGKIHALVVYSGENESYGIRNVRYKLEDTEKNKLIQLSEGYSPKIGDFVIAENGKLSKVDYMTNAQIVDMDGIKLLEIRDR